ncbi:MAG: RNA-binding domain-containing protein [Egibacteraceae bacterium]
MSKVDEAGFESFICDWLVEHGGYDAVKVGMADGAATDFDAARGLDTTELFAFVDATQADRWDQLRNLYGDPDKARRGFADRLAKELDARGTIDVLRHGVVDLGVTIRLAFFRPASGLTPELVERYGKNRLTVTRQLRYEAPSMKALDLCLFVNGVPVATAELKNALTGQGTDQAIEQYRTARDPKNPLLRRAVVHFAVDTARVAMTTRLAGKATRFLPYNRGHDLGAGNPPNPHGHRTSYLWERVWQRDAWLDLLNRFVHVEPTPKGSTKDPPVIFPRFHQWDAVLALTGEAREHGAGRDYLVQHSAGSGKSNTIAWLAHRLSSLHDAADAKVFDKVVVITDRRVLDKQLQDTIYQFEHAHGVVVRIDENSQQLADALAGEQARIVITTLQKFPVVTDKIGALPERTYAVIVDEAHSSQTGESATALKAVLGATKPVPNPDEPLDPAEDALAAAVAARGRQPNLSYFAFTATPKARTLELFGRYDPATDRHVPFHLYSLRQAIEEGFILDVLAHYVTYQTYWHIEQATPEDPTYDPGKARAAIARFVSLHPHQLAQKAEVIVEHYRRKVRSRIGGMAKAMVVTASREHAARYKLALDRYINNKGYTDVGVLVAFSGALDLDGRPVTESSMNEFPESQTATEFDTDAWHLLVVAEKYQTGFDQPKLYAMYVDKPLSGLAAVQTLSRLNRTYDRGGVRKNGTFVLDFYNDAEDIRAAFEPYYGATVAPPTDPNLLYDTRHALDPFGVLWPDEIERTVALLLTTGKVAHDRVHAALAPAVDRFHHGLDADEQDRFRDALNRFIRTYAFLSQVVAFTDAKLERDYRFCKALAALVRERGTEAVHPDVELTHLKVEQTFEGSVTLAETQGEVSTIFGGGKLHEPEDEPLSQIIARLNERFGTDFASEDRVFYDSVFDKLAQRTDIQQAAAVNTPDNFKLVLEKEAMAGVLDQLGAAEDMALAYVDNPELQAEVLSAYLPFVQGRAKVMHQEHCDIVDLLGPDRESTHLEYKATLRTHADSGATFKPLESASLKTIAAFMNSREGGTLLIGVADDGTVHGLESDYASRSKTDQDPRDWFQQHLANITATSMGDAAATLMRPQIHKVNGGEVCRVQVDPSGFPVDAKVIIQKPGGPKESRTEFYVRVANGTKALDAVEREKYIVQRWGNSGRPN